MHLARAMCSAGSNSGLKKGLLKKLRRWTWFICNWILIAWHLKIIRRIACPLYSWITHKTTYNILEIWAKVCRLWSLVWIYYQVFFPFSLTLSLSLFLFGRQRKWIKDHLTKRGCNSIKWKVCREHQMGKKENRIGKGKRQGCNPLN